MKSLLTVSVFFVVLTAAARARADDQNLLRSRPIEPLTRPPEHPVPRLKLSLVRFEVGHPTGGTIGLQSLHLDMYALSWRYLRAGIDLEAGQGHTVIGGAGTALRYGLVGLSGGFQIPGRITPFIEARIAAGVLGGTVEDTVQIPGTSVTATGLSAATWMWAGGVDVGAEFYVFGRSYISAAIGWIHSNYRGADFNGMSGVAFKDVSNDSLLFKIGFGI
jgi:hypothetical protein